MSLCGRYIFIFSLFCFAYFVFYRNEISTRSIEWTHCEKLPTNKKKKEPKNRTRRFSSLTAVHVQYIQQQKMIICIMSVRLYALYVIKIQSNSDCITIFLLIWEAKEFYGQMQ